MTEQYQMCQGKLLEMEKGCAHWKDEASNVTKDKQTIEDQLAQANFNSSDLIAQVHALSQNCRALQSELGDTTNENETIVSSLQQRLVTMEGIKRDEIQQLTVDLDICNSHLTQVNSKNSELVTQVQELSLLSNTLRNKLDVATQEHDVVKQELVEKVALVAHLETSRDTANQRALIADASTKEMNVEIDTLKAMLDARDAMEPHQPRGNHPWSGMMNLRGCAWNWHIHCLVDKSFSPWTIHFA